MLHPMVGCIVCERLTLCRGSEAEFLEMTRHWRNGLGRLGSLTVTKRVYRA